MYCYNEGVAIQIWRVEVIPWDTCKINIRIFTGQALKGFILTARFDILDELP